MLESLIKLIITVAYIVAWSRDVIDTVFHETELPELEFVTHYQ